MGKYAWLVVGLALGTVGCEVESPECARADEIEAYVDVDGDGFGTGEPQLVCSLSEGLVDNALDCNDSSDQVFPGAEERCNAVDDNCDGVLDDGLQQRTFYADVDGDGFGGLFPSAVACTAPIGYVTNDGDCDDDNADVSPGQDEVCNDGIDDDCDGRVDDADPDTLESSKTVYYPDTDADGFGWINFPEPLCAPVAGLVDNFRDCDDQDASITNFPFPLDADLDGYGDEIGTVMSCDGYPGTSDNREDCDDSDPWVNIPKAWYDDPDQDGYGAGDSVSFGCFPPNGLLVGPFFGDCDQTDPAVNEGELEVCDDGFDQDCDARVDCDDPTCDVDALCYLDCTDVGLPSEVPLTYEIGSMAVWGNDYSIPCVNGSEPDITLQWRAPQDGTYTFDTFGSTGGTGPGIAILDSCEPDARLFGCNAFSGVAGNRLQGRVTGVALSKDEIVIIQVDGQRGAAGSATGVVNITLE